MNKYIVTILMLLFSFVAHAYIPRNLLQKKAGLEQLSSVLLQPAQWVKYPSYSDRAGWDALTGSLKKELIARGESNLSYEWKIIKATDYLEYERSGSRVTMENPFGANNAALNSLVFAELAEGKGRFLDQIINGVWYTCEMSSWVLPAHLVVQKTRRSLPEFNEQVIDLTSGDMGSFLSWTWYFFHDEMNKVNPVIAAKLYKTIQERILQPYLSRNDYWWMALGNDKDEKEVFVNNWNPWCNFNVLTCFLLLEKNADTLSAAVYKTMKSVDKFLNYVKEDGACEEGPSYWPHAAGKLYDYLQLLSNATNGKVSVFNAPVVKNLGEYIARSYVGNGWVVNFADASAKGGGNPGLIYRYGVAVNSTLMQGFAAYLSQNGNKDEVDSRDFFRAIENLSSFKSLQQTPPALCEDLFSWYPETQFCYMKNKTGFFFAAKGGFNNESHNHNDVGTFSLYLNTTPVFIDAGVGTYTRETFSSRRYEIWTMQSNYHNLPMINGLPQLFGSQYRAKNVNFDAGKMTFALDISGAYNASANRWKRTYRLSNDELVIEDHFELTETKAPNQVNFLAWVKPDISTRGIVNLTGNGEQACMKYDAALFEPSVDVITLTDIRLSKVWGDEIYRLSLKAKKQQSKGSYKFTIKRGAVK